MSAPRSLSVNESASLGLGVWDLRFAERLEGILGITEPDCLILSKVQ